MIRTKKVEVPDVKYEKPEEDKTLLIYREQDPIDPRTYDTNGIMVCSHKRYDLGDESFNSDYYDGWSDYKKHLKEEKDVYVILPLYLYDHSGITISTTPFRSSWDSGQVGFIYTTKERLKRLGHDVDDLDKEKVKEWLASEVETYDDFLTGEIYRFVLKSGEEMVDSCGGFHDPRGKHLFEHAGIDDIEEWEEVETESRI